MTIKLEPMPLTHDLFAPFGEVIEVGDYARHYTINEGDTERYHALAEVEAEGEGSNVIISIFQTLRPSSFPHTVKIMERHPLGSQTFIPMCGTPFLIIVAPPGDSVSPSDLRAFITNGHQGVNYRKGVWHHSLLSFKAFQIFGIVDRKGPGNNCDFLTLDGSVLMDAPLVSLSVSASLAD